MPMVNPTAKVLLLCLARYSNYRGQCFPSQQKISDETLVPIRSVIRGLLWLEKEGFISIRKTPNKPNVYTILLMEEEPMEENGSAKLAPEVVSNITKLSIVNSNNDNTTSSCAKLAHPNETPAFKAFWNAYPRRIGKGAARTAFAKACKHTDSNQIIQGAMEYATHCNEMGTESQFIPHPSTWINAERWEDDLESEKKQPMKSAGWLNEL